MGNKGLDYTALVIAVIGAVNWGLIGLFRLDLVALIFGQMSWISRIIYVIVGICGIYLLTFFGRVVKRKRRISRKYEEASGRKKLFSGGLFSFGGRRAAVLFVKHPPE